MPPQVPYRVKFDRYKSGFLGCSSFYVIKVIHGFCNYAQNGPGAAPENRAGNQNCDFGRFMEAKSIDGA